MAAKRRKRKADVGEDLPNPGERQRCRLPDFWATTDPEELRKANARDRQLVAGEKISWDELTSGSSSPRRTGHVELVNRARSGGAFLLAGSQGSLLLHQLEI